MSITKHQLKAKSHVLTLLGNELIGSDSLAIFELVKNSYDADAQNVTIEFIDLNTKNQKIVIEDDGCGMLPKTIQDVWLTIGTDFKRGKNRKESPKFGRISFGNKGIGRLAVHKLAKEIILETQTIGDLFFSKLSIDWDKLIESKEYIQDLEVDLEYLGAIDKFKKGHGTKITLSNLTTNNWTKKMIRDLVRKINNIKNPFSTFPDFDIQVKCNDHHQEWIKDVKSSVELLEDSLYKFDFEVSLWGENTDPNFQDNLAEFKWSYLFNPPNQTKIEKRVVEKKSNKDNKTNDNFLHIGKLFEELDGLNNFNKYLRNKDVAKIGKIKGQFHVFNQSSSLLNMTSGRQITATKEYIKENCGVKIFRDNIRVYNYGESFDDWLSLDLDKIQRAGDHFGKKVTIGFIELLLKESNGLVEKTNREGFIDNLEYNKFSLLIRDIFRFFEREAAIDRDKIDEFVESTKPTKKVGFGETMAELQEKVKEKNLEVELAPFLKKVDADYIEMRDIMVNSGMAGLNLGLAFHEVDREIHSINAELNNSNVDIEYIKNKIKNLIQILENLSPILKQNKTINTNAVNIVESAKRINISRLEYHKIILSSPLLTGENKNFNFKGPSNLLVSALSNLIDNAIYWTTSKRDLVGGNFKSAIYIGTDIKTFGVPAIIIADNGSGFIIEPEELAKPFKTYKEGGMGLGLYFTDLVMNIMGGKLVFPDSADLEIPNAYNGACIALVFPK